jgi:hypothetical protein
VSEVTICEACGRVLPAPGCVQYPKRESWTHAGPLAQYVRAEPAERYKAALERLRTHPLLTRRYGPLEQAARQIVDDALRAR